MSHSIHQELYQIVVVTPELELGFSRESGALTSVRRPGGASVIGYGSDPISLDVRTADGWMRQRFFARYLSHQVADEAGATAITLRIGIGPLLISDCYHVTGTLVSRTVSVKNVGLDEVQLLGVWLALPWGRVGPPETCRFEAPANMIRPRLSLSSLLQIRRGSLPGPEITPMLRHSRLFESCPDRGPGLLALHSIDENENLLCWYFSDQQPAWPAVEGSLSDYALTLGHEMELAGWLRTDEALGGGRQYFMLVQGSWQEAMLAFQKTWSVIGLRAAGDVPGWVAEAAIYETHPALHGGFRALAEALPRLRALGVTVLALMPIWAYDNRSGRLWDGNWSTSGSPYAILDFERFEPTLGSDEDFRALVEQAHSLGIRLLLDLVVQGCALTSRYVAEHPTWFCRDARGRLALSRDWVDTYSFDWANQEFQAYMLDWALQLVQKYGIDGYRVNAPDHKEPNWDRRSGRHASATSLGVLQLLERLRRDLKEIKPDAALLCDMYGPVYVATHDAASDLLPHLMFYQAGLGHIAPVELSEWLEDAVHALPAGAIRICFAESHETRDFNPLADAMRGSRLSRLFLAALIACGYVPMLWYGQEQGQEPFIRRLLHLRRSSRMLREGKPFYNTVPCDVAQIFCVLRHLDQQWLLCVFNMSPHKRLATFSLPVDQLALRHEAYSLHELIGGHIWEEHGRRSWHYDDLLRLAITVEPYGCYFFALIPGSTIDTTLAQQRPVPSRRLQQPGYGRRPGRRRRGKGMVQRKGNPPTPRHEHSLSPPA
ncbi:MAG: hypothetical protein KatS3mg057_1801 [Herpetosiphonaceae bacterium]|nr:MAG: hypothetical protein KatS3mg057_1801 [Herpetosiphonaceae bacterium]